MQCVAIITEQRKACHNGVMLNCGIHLLDCIVHIHVSYLNEQRISIVM
jgi:hypothetical protein